MWKTLVLLLHCLVGTQAVVWVTTTDDLYSNTTSSCIASLGTDLACDSSLAKLRPSIYPPEEILSSVCTSACAASLGSYEAAVSSACGDQTYDSVSSTGQVPILTIPQLLRYTYNFSCLTDSSSRQYCKVLSAEAAGINADQSNLGDPDVSGGGTADGCTDCDLKILQFQASSPFYSNAEVSAQYSSATSSCQKTGYPLTTVTPVFTAPTPSPTNSTCTGRTYEVQSGDTCKSISKAQKIGTNWLLMDNNVPAYCADFPTNGTLCLGHSCPTITLEANSTCNGLAKANNMTYAQLLAWNPSIDLACSNLDKQAGYELCVGNPDPGYVAPTSTSLSVSPTTATSPVAIPTDIANGTTTNCGSYYQAVPGDYCNLLLIRYGLSLGDFLVLNPEVNENCTNLFAYESYCILPVGDIGNYPGAPGSNSASLTGTPTAFASLPTATYIPPLFGGYNRTYANQTRQDCQYYADGADLTVEVNGTFYDNTCQLAAVTYGISLENLAMWNPSLGDTSAVDCAFDTSLWYCLGFGGNDEDSDGGTTETTPIADGTTSECDEYIEATSWDNCTTLLTGTDVTLAEFYALNPEVGADCSKFVGNYRYCLVGTPAPPSTTTSAVPPGPTQSGQPADCNAWYIAKEGDSCTVVEDLFGISSAQFHAWNPAVSDDCSSGFWADEAYCVGTGSPISVTTTSTPTTTTTTTSSSSAPTPPAPTQDGQPSDCNKWFVAKADTSCADAEAAGGITAAQFFEWNPAVSSDCVNGFWADEAYCIGRASVSGGTTTTTTTKATTTTSSPTSPTPPAPTQDGQPSNCNAWYVPVSGDDCGVVETKYQITDAQFHAWNPAVSSDCLSGFWVGEAYCVGLAS
ncbi:hypothetical protein F4802DRAFT_613319 [Xylaria palmicola]|nr:hypothetical protein F4802DRAFT_613319 [Xylaria palmicola]